MERVDIECPICKTINKGLDIHETDGWFECEKCKNEIQILKYAKTKKIPLLTPEALTKYFKKEMEQAQTD